MAKRLTVFIVLTVLCLTALVAALLVGPALKPAVAARALVETLAGHGSGVNGAIITYRLTRLLAAAAVGLALAVAGTALQALLRNPLADPYILGISAGGGFGAAVAVALGLGAGATFSAVNLFAFAGALAAIGVGFAVARAAGILSVHALLLAGVMVGAFFTSLILLVLAVVPARDQHAVFLWLMGDLGSPDITPAKVLVTWAFVAAAAGGLGLGARALDVVALASLATAATVALAGPIGFVGIVVPHALRRLVGPRHHILLPAAALGGVTLVVAGDVLVRVSADYLNLPIVPVGVFTALIGAPYFLFLLKRRAG